MKISWIGHACFLLETDKSFKIITDPYESGSYSGAVRYKPVDIPASVVTISHQHPDHNYRAGFKAARIIDKPGKIITNGIEINGISSFHDQDKGKLRGGNIIFIFIIEGLKIIHFGDLGTLDMDLTDFKDVDIALIPVGGTFTIDAQQATELIKTISPRISIPMHFKTEKLDFDIDEIDSFIFGKDYEKRNILEVNKENIDSFKKVVVLEHQR